MNREECENTVNGTENPMCGIGIANNLNEGKTQSLNPMWDWSLIQEMMHGQSNGKKLMAFRIIEHGMEIIHLSTDQNPIQVTVDAVINSGPSEDAETKDGHLRFVQVEAILQNLWNLHSQSQEQQKALALELELRLQRLKQVEKSKFDLEEERELACKDPQEIRQWCFRHSICIG